MDIPLALGSQVRFIGIDGDIRSRFRQVWYQAGRLVVRLYSNMMFSPNITFRAPLPTGPRILAANHPSTIDPFLMTLLVNEPVCILILDTLFKIPVVGFSLRLSGHIRVDPDAGRKAMEQSRQALQAGCTLGIFPEGIISPPEGGMHPLHSGMARLALASGAPVIPVGIALDTARLKLLESQVDGKMEMGAWYMRGPYAITVGEPLTFRGNPEDRNQVGKVSEQIVQQIGILARQSARRLRMENWGLQFAMPPLDIVPAL